MQRLAVSCFYMILCVALSDLSEGDGVRRLEVRLMLFESDDTIWYIEVSMRIPKFIITAPFNVKCRCYRPRQGPLVNGVWFFTRTGSSHRVGAVERLLSSTLDLIFGTVLCALSTSTSTSTS